MSNENDLSDTIVPKSDQLNADDLLTGPITVTITSVKRSDTKDQPVMIGIEDGKLTRQPYKPRSTVLQAATWSWWSQEHTTKTWTTLGRTLSCAALTDPMSQS